MRRGRLAPLALALAVGGCSALINPDSNRLGEDPDAGPDVTLMDGGGPPPGTDAGGPPPGTDAGGPPPGTDAGGPPPGTDAGGPPPGTDAGCLPVCAGGTVTTCDGDVTSCPFGCALDGSPRCAAMVPSNVDASLWRNDARDLTVMPTSAGGLSFDTTACMARMVDSTVVTQSDGSELCVLMVRDLVVRRDAGLRVRGSRPLVIMVTGDVTIEENGYLDVGAELGEPGPGGAAGGTRGATDGGGATGGEAGAHAGMFDDGGGGGGGLCGAGGDGGSGGAASGGPGGGALSAAEVNLLIPLRAGSGGGMGEGGFGPGDLVGNAGLGGAGGGAIQISALGRVRIDGLVLAGGGGGLGGRNDIMQWGAGGGGGSGGGVLIEAPDVELGGSAQVTTSGGGGAGSASDSRDGFNGQDGSVTIDRANGGFRGGNDFGADGGRSGGGTANDGEDGGDNGRSAANGGGGGGGVGCVVYRTFMGGEPSGARDRTSGRAGGALFVAPIMLR